MFEDVKSKLVGGAVVLVLGGTGFAITQTDVVNNFAQETGMTQEEAQKYADDTSNNAASFEVVGDDLIKSGQDGRKAVAEIDCEKYTYEWESAALSCVEGKSQLKVLAQNDIELGECFKALDEDLGAAAKSKIQECINEIDQNNAGYDENPIASKLYGNETIEETKKSNLYNKSVLRTALES